MQQMITHQYAARSCIIWIVIRQHPAFVHSYTEEIIISLSLSFSYVHIYLCFMIMCENVGYLHPSFCDYFSHIYYGADGGAEKTINYVSW